MPAVAESVDPETSTVLDPRTSLASAAGGAVSAASIVRCGARLAIPVVHAGGSLAGNVSANTSSMS
jgi:hypothetical protein